MFICPSAACPALLEQCARPTAGMVDAAVTTPPPEEAELPRAPKAPYGITALNSECWLWPDVTAHSLFYGHFSLGKTLPHKEEKHSSSNAMP